MVFVVVFVVVFWKMIGNDEIEVHTVTYIHTIHTHTHIFPAHRLCLSCTLSTK